MQNSIFVTNASKMDKCQISLNYVYIYIYMYIHIWVYIYIYLHNHTNSPNIIYIYIYIYIFVHLHTQVSAHISLCGSLCIYPIHKVISIRIYPLAKMLHPTSIHEAHISIHNHTYPLVITNIAMENGHSFIVSFPMRNGGSFQLVM